MEDVVLKDEMIITIKIRNKVYTAATTADLRRVCLTVAQYLNITPKAVSEALGALVCGSEWDRWVDDCDLYGQLWADSDNEQHAAITNR